jgi:branched-chain amino acid transport system substrate-binding protein
MQKQLSRKVVFLVMMVIALFSVTSLMAQDDEIIVEEGEPVTLGIALSLSGDTAPFGIDIVRGIEFGLEDRPTVMVDGVEFEVALDEQDSACNAETGQAVANRFASDENIVGVIGHMCSSACSAAAPIYDSAGYSMISPSCTAPVLTQRGFTSFNRAVVPDGIQGALAAEFIFDNLGLTTIATIHDGSPYGEGLVDVVATAFTDLGGEVVASDAVNVGDTDFRALLEDFAAQEPDLIYFGGFPAEAALIAEQLPDAGLADVVFMGADGIQGPEYINLAGDASEGTFASVAIPFSSDELDAFVERYINEYEEEPPGPYHPNGYDAYNLFLDAIEATGTVNDEGSLVLSRSAIQEYLRSFEEFEGLTGLLTADGTGETASSAIGFYEVVDGAFVEVAILGGMDDMMDDDMMGEATIADIVMGDESFSTLLLAVETAGLTDALAAQGPITVFAPTNDGFDAALAELGMTPEEILGDTALLTSILTYHVVEGAVFAEDVVELDEFTTLSGETVTVTVTEEGDVVLNDTVTVIDTDIEASNGVIHVIDFVLVPPMGE